MRYSEIIAAVLDEADTALPIKPTAPAKSRADAYQTRPKKRTRYQTGNDSRWQTPPRPASKGPGSPS